MASPKGNMAQGARESLTPQDETMKALRSFEEALKTLESACCLYTEFTDFADPYDDHIQPRRRELQRTYQST